MDPGKTFLAGFTASLGAMIGVGLLSALAISGCAQTGADGGNKKAETPKAATAREKELLAKPKDEWMHSDLEEFLNARGMAVTRVSARGSMWYGPGVDGEALKVLDAESAKSFAEAGLFYAQGNLPVEKQVTSKAATAVAVQIVDEKQLPAFAWGPFVFRGDKSEVSRETVKKFKSILER